MQHIIAEFIHSSIYSLIFVCLNKFGTLLSEFRNLKYLSSGAGRRCGRKWQSMVEDWKVTPFWPVMEEDGELRGFQNDKLGKGTVHLEDNLG